MTAGSAKMRLRNMPKRFVVHGRPIGALAGIDLDIGVGEFFCIVGPWGCGKTTLLRILADLETRTSGSIEITTDRRV
jgi:NitT/TauT family transport system ATP-binding protein